MEVKYIPFQGQWGVSKERTVKSKRKRGPIKS
jgi:hypothetical protein